MTTVEVKLNKWMRLPRLGGNAFRDLMRAGVKYDSKRGFLITSESDLEKIARIISGALKGVSVEIVHECMGCGREMTCEGCEYHPQCTIEEVSAPCICGRCLEDIDMEEYSKIWSEKYLKKYI